MWATGGIYLGWTLMYQLIPFRLLLYATVFYDLTIQPLPAPTKVGFADHIIKKLKSTLIWLPDGCCVLYTDLQVHCGDCHHLACMDLPWGFLASAAVNPAWLTGCRTEVYFNLSTNKRVLLLPYLGCFTRWKPVLTGNSLDSGHSGQFPLHQQTLYVTSLIYSTLLFPSCKMEKFPASKWWEERIHQGLWNTQLSWWGGTYKHIDSDTSF